MQKLAFSGKYGRMILLSGDLDFCVAVEDVQEMGVAVCGVRFLNGKGRSDYYSRELRRGMDKVIDMRNGEFRRCFDRMA
jgi:uncharacterized LabA/DUF88 family protein